jgi:hypothetical protein
MLYGLLYLTVNHYKLDIIYEYLPTPVLIFILLEIFTDKMCEIMKYNISTHDIVAFELHFSAGVTQCGFGPGSS